MPKCHICGKASNYSQMVDYNLYSVHSKCEEKKKKEDDNNILTNSKSSYDYKKVIYSCPICKTNNNKGLSKLELRKHLESQHTKAYSAIATYALDFIERNMGKEATRTSE